MKVLGSSTGDLPKVPTLKQAIAAKLALPNFNLVTLVFKPNKYPVLTFQCEEKFRVNVREGESLYEELIELLPTLVASKETLFVEVPNNSQGRFIMHLCAEEQSEWEEFDWGYRATLVKRVSKGAGKKLRGTLVNG
jgi:hypothetical protein